MGLLALPLAWIVGSCGSGGSNQPNSLQPAESVLRFNEISQAASLDHQWGYLDSNVVAVDAIHRFCGGVAAGDVDRDGLVDLFVVRGSIGPHQLYRNLGDNKFSEIASSAGISIDGHRGCGPSFADIDGDGDLDLFIGGFSGERSYLLINQIDETGALMFVDQTSEFGLDGTSAGNTVSSSFGDYDQDGWLDLFLANWGTPKSQAKQYLWRNINGSRFENTSAVSRVGPELTRTPLNGAVRGPLSDYSFLGAFADTSNDGYPDLHVVSDFRTTQVLINQRDGTFLDATDHSVLIDENGMGSAIGDIDNDGDLDWFVTAIFNTASPGNRFYQNQGAKPDGSVEFLDRTSQMDLADGRWGWGACMADFNMDGILDIFHVNGWNATIFDNDYRRTPSRLYVSVGGFHASGLPKLVDTAASAGITTTSQGRAVVCFDSDNDGDVDILAVNNDQRAIQLFRNDQTTGNKYLSVLLQGAAPNTAAANARIYVKTGETEQMREINIGSNFISQNPLRQYFGLGDNTSVDELRVEWRDGKTPATANTVMMDVNANQHLTIPHPGRTPPS